MLIPVLLFVLGLLFLIKGGDWFVDGASGIARRFKLPDVIVGATVVSIGTTLPEVMVSATGALGGQSSMAYGNSIGSIICNTALIAAITAACNPSKVNARSMRMPIIFFFASAGAYCAAAYILGSFPRWLGIVMLVIFVSYLFLTVKQGLKDPEMSSEENGAKQGRLWLDIVLLIIGAALIAVGADLLVDNGTVIAQKLGVPETVIALTFVALGTSLPELVTTITSLRKGHASLGVGNMIGANIFNLVLVSGISVTLAPFDVPVGNTLFGINSSLVLDIPLMLATMGILTVPALIKGRLSRWQGITLLALYVGFCALQFAL